MKLIIFILLSTLTFAQNSAVVRGELVTIKDGSQIIISEFIDSARIETPHTINRAGKLNEVLIANVEPLPAIGEMCYKNKLYASNGQVIICLQDHPRTIYNPEDTPNLFNFYRSGTDLEWQVNELVAKDDIRIYQGVKYKCLLGHTCLMTWTPPATIGILWVLDTSGQTCPAWIQLTGAHDAYNIGDCVIYLGKCYESLINANVWSPTVYPAGWKEISCN